VSSTFGALNVAASGLAAAQRALDVTGQNVANANTDGYSRQRVEFRSIGASSVPAIWSTSSGIGDGVNADDVTRVRDAFLESRAQVEHSANAQLTAADAAYTQVQQAFREPGDTGLQSQLTGMWNAWHDVASSKGATAQNTALLATTQTLVDGLHSTAASLDAQWNQSASSLQSLVADVNGTAANIAQLNHAISQATAAGQSPNELLDKRDALVLGLSDQIGATSQTRPDGTVDVSVGGVTLVSGTNVNKLAVAGSPDPAHAQDAVPATTDPAYLVSGRPRIVSVVGNAVVSAGGTAAGQLTAMTSIIPSYHAQLDAIASALAAAVNGQQTQGYDNHGDPGAALLGPSAGTQVTAANISLLTTDPAKIAASKLGPTTGPGGTTVPAADGSNADAIGQLGSGNGSVDATYRAMITQLGVQAASTSRNLDIQTTVTSTVDADREGVSGVSTDEEMTNMLQYQNSYSASARMVSAIDQMMDTLINHMGLVGNV
jgi:flagellar hook-associated protein FlgK